MKRFCAAGSADVTTTSRSDAPRRPKTPAAITHATAGCPTDFRATDSSTGTRSEPRRAGSELPHSEIPYASSTTGTDILPIRSTGLKTGPGTVHPVAATITPASAPTAIGLRSGVTSRRHSDCVCPASDRSRTVIAIGVTTICWNSSTGATSEASPRTYTAMGMPRFPELT